ncbi:MAG TPA: 6-phosphogluconolactonase [Candidatus Limnocylindrales bacterium]|nr:6-phosphogluconolactonase [Candidatus Limnocylindrales bacterium]
MSDRDPANEPEIRILPDPEACAAAAAQWLAASLVEAAAARGTAYWATTGGSAPAAIYRRLAVAPLRDEVPWEQVLLWWGDDRFVPFDHPLSNVAIAYADLLDVGATSGESGTGASGVDVLAGRSAGAPIHAGNVHPFPIPQAIAEGQGPDWTAERYVEMLRADGPPTEGGWPAFDILFLGIGPDGHCLSVFPDSEAFDSDAIALGIPAPTHVEPHVARVTLNPRVVDTARKVLVVAHGAEKADVLGAILGAERDVRRLPAQLARRTGATWILDEAAAARLPR